MFLSKYTDWTKEGLNLPLNRRWNHDWPSNSEAKLNHDNNKTTNLVSFLLETMNLQMKTFLTCGSGREKERTRVLRPTPLVLTSDDDLILTMRLQCIEHIAHFLQRSRSRTEELPKKLTVVITRSILGTMFLSLTYLDNVVPTAPRVIIRVILRLEMETRTRIQWDDLNVHRGPLFPFAAVPLSGSKTTNTKLFLSHFDSKSSVHGLYRVHSWTRCVLRMWSHITFNCRSLTFFDQVFSLILLLILPWNMAKNIFVGHTLAFWSWSKATKAPVPRPQISPFANQPLAKCRIIW